MAKAVICNCCYNVNKQLVKKLEFLWYSKGYLKDAKKQKHKKCEKMWKELIKNEKKQVELLKEACSKGFC